MSLLISTSSASSTTQCASSRDKTLTRSDLASASSDARQCAPRAAASHACGAAMRVDAMRTTGGPAAVRRHHQRHRPAAAAVQHSDRRLTLSQYGGATHGLRSRPPPPRAARDLTPRSARVV